MSYVTPVSLRRAESADNPYLELFLYQNRLQLATRDALYSDGDKYTPAIEVCRHFRAFLPQIQNVLVLGTGLGSLVQVMERKGYRPKYTLVEKEKVILQWAIEFAAPEMEGLLDPVCEDAATFVKRDSTRYNFIFIDIFHGRFVPEFVCTESFLLACRDRIAPGGHLAFNYIINDPQEWQHVQQVFSSVFPGYKVINRGDNMILAV